MGEFHKWSPRIHYNMITLGFHVVCVKKLNLEKKPNKYEKKRFL